MKLQVMDVTPVQAKTWLKMNTLNRPVRKFYVQALADAMKRGEFVPNHQAVALNGSKLIDGQHRLMAVIASGLPAVKMSVIQGADTSTFDTIDIGVKRSDADIFREDPNVMNPISYIARLLMGAGKPTPKMKRPIYEKLQRQMREVVNAIPRNKRGFTASSIRVGALAAILSGEDKAYVLSLYRAMADFDTKNLPPVAASFVQQIMLGKSKAANNNQDLMVRSFTVFQKDNADLRRLMVKKTADRVAEIREIYKNALSIGG